VASVNEHVREATRVHLREHDGDMGWPDLISKLAVMVMMMIDNLVSPMISPR
jgi:hypothetical protein